MRDISSLDLNLLKAFDALIDERSVTRAAARLGLTQPAVSGMLTRLRDAFDDPLFIRTSRGVVPTARAQDLTGPVKKVLNDIGALMRPVAFDPALAEFTVNMSATDYALQAVVLPLLTALRTRAPGIRLAVRPAEAQPLQERFEFGDIDIALMTPEGAWPNLQSRHLFDESYVCAMREDHALAALPLTLDAFCSADQALVTYKGDRFEGVTDERLALEGRSRRVIVSVTSFLALNEILRTTDLIAVVPRRLVLDAPRLVIKEPPISIPGFTKIAVWHERTHRDPGQAWLRALMFEACRMAS